MKRNAPKVPPMYTLSEAQRRKVAEDFRKLASDPKRRKADRADFARIAETWQRTLPEKK